MTLKEWLGISCLIAGASLFPSLLIYGFIRGRILNLSPGGGVLSAMTRTVTGSPARPLIVSRIEHPKAFWFSTGICTLLTLCLVGLAYAYAFLPHAT